jgi:hypothetical protein
MLDAGCWMLDTIKKYVFPPMEVRISFPQITQIDADGFLRVDLRQSA